MSHEYGSGSGTNRLYVVEARLTGHQPARTVNGILLTREWRCLPVIEIPSDAQIQARRIAVPLAGYPSLAREHGLLEREAAYAMAVRFQVESGEDNPYSVGHAVLCVETRLVEVECKWHYEIVEIGVCEPLSLFDHLRWLKSTPRTTGSVATGLAPQPEP